MAKVLTAGQRAELHRQLDEILDPLPRELKGADKVEQQIYEGLRRLRDAGLEVWKKSANSDDEG
ncbi:MAG: hypothetical protein ACUVQK_06755 [Thermogutta sp.]